MLKIKKSPFKFSFIWKKLIKKLFICKVYNNHKLIQNFTALQMSQSFFLTTFKFHKTMTIYF